MSATPSPFNMHDRMTHLEEDVEKANAGIDSLAGMLRVMLDWIQRQDAMAQAMSATLEEASDSPVEAFATMADVIGLYASDSPFGEAKMPDEDHPVWTNSRVGFGPTPRVTVSEADKRQEYGYDRGYWSAMIDILRHLNAWEADGLKQPIAGDDGRYSGFGDAEEMIRHQIRCFLYEAPAGWGEEFPPFEEWSA